MKCEYDGREITGEPFKVIMRGALVGVTSGVAGPLDAAARTPDTGYSYFHDSICYELFAEDEAEYEASNPHSNLTP